jgi:hypothetical protein
LDRRLLGCNFRHSRWLFDRSFRRRRWHLIHPWLFDRHICLRRNSRHEHLHMPVDKQAIQLVAGKVATTMLFQNALRSRDRYPKPTHEESDERCKAAVLAVDTPTYDHPACTQLAPYAFKRGVGSKLIWTPIAVAPTNLHKLHLSTQTRRRLRNGLAVLTMFFKRLPRHGRPNVAHPMLAQSEIGWSQPQSAGTTPAIHTESVFPTLHLNGPAIPI